MPDKGNTEITIPTYRGMTTNHTKDATEIIIYSTTGKITIKCYQFHHEDKNDSKS